MKCSVEGCHNESCGQPGGSKEVKLCEYHWKRWGTFYTGYECGYFGEQEAVRHGRLNKKRWEKAMLAFLDWCAIEISACVEIAEAYIRISSHS
jgi:hypothetical protein